MQDWVFTGVMLTVGFGGLVVAIAAVHLIAARWTDQDEREDMYEPFRWEYEDMYEYDTDPD